MIETVSAREAARRIGVNERTVRRWISKDAGRGADARLPGSYVDEHTGVFHVPVAALERYKPAELEPASEAAPTPPTIVADIARPAGWIERASRSERTLEVLRRLAAIEAWAAVRAILDMHDTLEGER